MLIRGILGRLMNYGDRSTVRGGVGEGRRDHQDHCLAARTSAITSPRDRERRVHPWPCSKNSKPNPYANAAGSIRRYGRSCRGSRSFQNCRTSGGDPNGKDGRRCTRSIRCGWATSATAACRKFERNVQKGLSCLVRACASSISAAAAGLLCEPFTRLGAQVIGVDPSATNIAAARLHADKGHLSIDYRCTTVEQMDVRRALRPSCWRWKWSSMSPTSACSSTAARLCSSPAAYDGGFRP